VLTGVTRVGKNSLLCVIVKNTQQTQWFAVRPKKRTTNYVLPCVFLCRASDRKHTSKIFTHDKSEFHVVCMWKTKSKTLVDPTIMQSREAVRVIVKWQEKKYQPSLVSTSTEGIQKKHRRPAHGTRA
jgi:hypothetical protein